jgi:putative membrane protein
MYPTRSSNTVIAAALAALVLAGCETRRDTEPPQTGAVGSATDTAGVAPAAGDTTTSVGAATGTLTDANIVALLDEANKADSVAGAFARPKATDPDVKAYAQLMMTEHHLLRQKGQELAKKLNLTPEPPADDPVKAAAKAEMEALRAAPKGAQFDRTYIDQEVTIHKAVIDLAEQAHAATQNAELKGLIETAKPYLERHLERAESIQKKLGKPTA